MAQSEVHTSSIWQSAATKAQAYRDASLADTLAELPPLPTEVPLNVTSIPRQLLSPEDLSITELDPDQLLAALADRKLTSVAVTTAFLRRAALAQKLANCVTELLRDRALLRARELDEHIERHGTPVGPLHGLPISVKEHIGMKGLMLNAGFCSQVDNESEIEATILQLLANAGAIFHVRTTQPQTLMHLETSSNLYGVTVNPYNTSLTAGGSSGGEGALLALRGSVLGIGSDIGGSIRSPSANNGIFGLKPSVARLPSTGSAFSMRGNEQVLGTSGPMSTSLAGIEVFMQAVIGQQPWILEPWVSPLAWKHPKEALDQSRTLRVAVMWDDGVVRPHPPVMRALKETVDKLNADPGIEVTEWVPWQHEYAWDLITRLYFTDGGQNELDDLRASDEPLRPLSKFILKEQPGVRELSGREIWAITNERNRYRAAYNQKWNETAKGGSEGGAPSDPVDVILCPAGPGAAPPLDCARYWGYTSQWNLLDYSAMTFPVSKVDLTTDKADVSYKPRNGADEFNHGLYAPEKYVDAPISLQVVARRYQEEKLLAAVERIMESMESHKSV